MGSSQLFSLRWNNYLRHITGAFDSLRSDEDLVDVTLSCEGKKIRAHKMLLSACSSYFRDLFKENPCQHPVIIFKNVKFVDLEALVEFMYQGEVNVIQDQLASFMTTAELLAVQGLTDGNSRDGLDSSNDEVKVSERIATVDEQDGKKLTPSPPPPPPHPPSPVPSASATRAPDSPPTKKRKFSCVSVSDLTADGNKIDGNNIDSISVSARSVMNILHEEEEKRKTKNPSETIKIEIPDYFDQDSVELAVYSDTSRERSEVVLRGDKNVHIYNTNSSSTGQQGGNSPLLDISQVMGGSGPSLDSVPQEPLLGYFDGDDRMKQFGCTTCGKKFRHKPNLYAHMKLHTGETECSYCKRIFATMQGLNRHTRLHHGILMH